MGKEQGMSLQSAHYDHRVNVWKPHEVSSRSTSIEASPDGAFVGGFVSTQFQWAESGMPTASKADQTRAAYEVTPKHVQARRAMTAWQRGSGEAEALTQTDGKTSRRTSSYACASPHHHPVS